MITLFEEYTNPLNEQEHDRIMPLITGMLRVGKNNSITNLEMRRRLFEIHGIRIHDSRVRKIISYARIKDIVPRLVSNSKGYYISESEEEIETYMKSLQQRATAIYGLVHALRRQSTGYFQQSSLFILPDREHGNQQGLGVDSGGL